MKNVLVYALIMATLLPIVSPWGTIAYYHLNKDYIARVLCENRDRPQLHCDGKCYLAKQLKAQQDKQDKETTKRVQNISPMQLFCQDQFRFNFLNPVFSWITQYPIYRLPSYTRLPAGLFRPPRV